MTKTNEEHENEERKNAKNRKKEEKKMLPTLGAFPSKTNKEHENEERKKTQRTGRRKKKLLPKLREPFPLFLSILAVVVRTCRGAGWTCAGPGAGSRSRRVRPPCFSNRPAHPRPRRQTGLREQDSKEARRKPW